MAATKTVTKTPIYKKKLFIPIIVLVVFAAVGAYIVGTSHASSYSVSGLYGCNGTPNLAQGNVGDCVKALQYTMNNWAAARSYFSGGTIPYTPLAIDGNFGPSTKTAVMNYQRAYSAGGKRLAVDGQVGPATWTAIQNDCSAFQACRFPSTVQ